MQPIRTITVPRLAFLMLLAMSLPSEGQDAGTSVRSGTGSVSLSQRGVMGLTGERQFNLQFRPTDTGELFTGSIRVTGADGFDGGSLGEADWELNGSRLTGKLEKQGRTLVSFEGTVGQEETSGTFTTAGGRNGSWTWEGPPPAE